MEWMDGGLGGREYGCSMIMLNSHHPALLPSPQAPTVLRPPPPPRSDTLTCSHITSQQQLTSVSHRSLVLVPVGDCERGKRERERGRRDEDQLVRRSCHGSFGMIVRLHFQCDQSQIMWRCSLLSEDGCLSVLPAVPLCSARRRDGIITARMQGRGQAKTSRKSIRCHFVPIMLNKLP